MAGGNHEVRASWGFLAVRLPMPEDKQWAADRATILQGLGVLDPAGKSTGGVDVVKAADVARLTQESWQTGRDAMLKTCAGCHAASFAQTQLSKGDDMIREADHLMAEGIRTVAGLYQDGILAKPANYASPFPDLLTFHDAPTPHRDPGWPATSWMWFEDRAPVRRKVMLGPGRPPAPSEHDGGARRFGGWGNVGHFTGRTR